MATPSPSGLGSPICPSTDLPELYTPLCPEYEDLPGLHDPDEWRSRPSSLSLPYARPTASDIRSSMSAARDDESLVRSTTSSPAPSSGMLDSIMTTDDSAKDSESTSPSLANDRSTDTHESHHAEQSNSQTCSAQSSSGGHSTYNRGVSIGSGSEYVRRRLWEKTLGSHSPTSMATPSEYAMANSEYAGEEPPTLGHETTRNRLITRSPSSLLRAGSRFRGSQKSERQRYKVDVEIKHIDLEASSLCGYLRIQGLTADQPSLTTYFEGEIIGLQHGFNTQHSTWGASDKTDLSHWSKFPAYRPTARYWRKHPPQDMCEVAQREHIFMRWKEHFLVPDHLVPINGASFEGFYYICFNQVEGMISGMYYHAKSERFQQLELAHVDDRGCCNAMEFR